MFEWPVFRSRHVPLVLFVVLLLLANLHRSTTTEVFIDQLATTSYDDDAEKHAWVTMASEDIHVKHALAMFRSLRDVQSRADLVMLVINHAGTVDVIKTYLSPIRALGVKMKRVENPVNPDDVRNPAFRKVIEDLGKWWDFNKLHVYNLTEYTRAVFLDADMLFLSNADEIFSFPSGSHSDGPLSPFNSGLFVVEPSANDYRELIEIVTEGDFSYKTGWRHKWSENFNAAETTQGLLYYFHHFLKNDSSLLLNRTVWNYQSLEPVPRETKILHFTACGKPSTDTSSLIFRRCPVSAALVAKHMPISRPTLSLTKDETSVIENFQALYERHKIHQKQRFFGVRFGQDPFDAFVIQEVLMEVKPDLIIKTGSNSGGSALWLSFLMEHIRPECKIVTIEAIEGGISYWHEHFKQASDPRSHVLWKTRVFAIEGYSTDPSVVGFIEKEFISQASVVLVILDSDHGEKVVREEIQTYSRLVSIGSYLVVEDTWIDGAKAAVDDFLKTTQEFVVDTSREHLMFTQHRGGYLTRIV